jgi:hypothetical protein
MTTEGARKKMTSTVTQKQKKDEKQTIGDEPHFGIKGLDIDVKWRENKGKTITHC